MGLTGHLDLVCGLDSRGLTSLRRQSFRAPMHVSKPYLQDGLLVVNVVNPTAGLLDGDRIDCRIEVQPGAKMLLTAPSASRAHRMKGGRAEMHQEFRVGRGAFLEVLPELFIPQAGARYRQSTVCHVDEAGELIFFETLAPGRVASGEAFAYQSLDWETNLFLEGNLIARERYRMAPEGPEIETLRARFSTAYYASCFVITSRLDHESACWREIHELHTENAWIGVSKLVSGGWVVKVVAENSVTLRSIMSEIRGRLYMALGEASPSLRSRYLQPQV